MDILEILSSHGVDVDHFDGVPPTWGDVIDRLFVDLRDLGWRGHLRSIASRNGTLEVEFAGKVTPAMLARVVRAADEARLVCEECGAAAQDERPGRTLCSRCSTLDAAVAAALSAVPDGATLGTLVYELYVAWDLRRRIATLDEERKTGRVVGYSSEEVFDELRLGSIEGPPLSPSEPPLALSAPDWNLLVEALDQPPESNCELNRRPCEPSGSDEADGRSIFLARLRRDRTWKAALESPARSVTLSGVSWDTCRMLRQQEAGGARFTYRAGTLEIREPGPSHQLAAAALAEAVATASRVCDERLEILTAPAFEDEDVGVTVAPDLAVLCPGAGRRTDLVVDIAFDDSAARRLEIYALLAVPEVWHFGRDAVEILLLGESGYVDAMASALLPALRQLTLRHVVETAIRGDLVDARRYTERVLGKQ